MSGLLNFTSATLTLAYFALCFLASLGLLQIVAAHEGLVGLTFIRGPRRWSSYALGGALIAGSFAWFFATQREPIFQPGLAGSELFLIFGLAALLALLLTLGLVSLRQPQADTPAYLLLNPNAAFDAPAGSSAALATSDGEARAGASLVGQDVTFGQAKFQGRLYQVSEATTPLPAVCVVPNPVDDPRGLDPLAESLAEAGWVALVVDWSAIPAPRYPGVLAVLPAALSYLARREEVHADRLAFLGFDLGADLALRAASSDPSVRAVVALAPLLSQDVADFGLGLLRKWSYWQAWQRSGLSRRLLAELEPLARLNRLAERPVLVVYGGRDGVVNVEKARDALREAGPGCRVEVLSGEGHRDVARSPQAAGLVRRWLERQSVAPLCHGEHG